jgi:hypothetical protein
VNVPRSEISKMERMLTGTYGNVSDFALSIGKAAEILRGWLSSSLPSAEAKR